MRGGIIVVSKVVVISGRGRRVGYVRARNVRMIGGHIEYNNIVQEVV